MNGQLIQEDARLKTQDPRRETQDSRRKTQDLREVCGLLSWALSLFLAGCAQQHAEVADQIRVPDIGKAEAMQVAEDVLAKMHFTIEKADDTTGYIKTRPLAGAQFFEFWRSDNVGSASSLQANLHSIRRTVELDIGKRDEELRISCDVHVQRLFLPERQIGSNARGYEMFSTSSPTIQRLRLDAKQRSDMAWVDLGKDKQLATEILKRIENRLKRETSN